MTDYTNISEIPEWAKQMACDKANARADCVLWVLSEIGAGLSLAGRRGLNNIVKHRLAEVDDRRKEGGHQ